ncbi:hypothetical protein TNCV_4391091 [Trichonephila clavipes]|nr:hypothetical protein TNCV_4391091 [Trichonephila clavipes]
MSGRNCFNSKDESQRRRKEAKLGEKSARCYAGTLQLIIRTMTTHFVLGIELFPIEKRRFSLSARDHVLARMLEKRST